MRDSYVGWAEQSEAQQKSLRNILTLVWKAAFNVGLHGFSPTYGLHIYGHRPKIMDEIKSTNFSPLTKDFIDIGRASCYGDTRRFRTELLPEICDKTILEGVIELNALTLLLNTEGSSVVPICR